MPQTEEELCVNISEELTFTPLAGASLVNEIIKGLLYQKCQIPYPYSWLKQVVEKRRKKSSSSETGPKKINFTHENHYRLVSTAYDYLDLIMKGITKEFCETKNTVKEIVVLFGPSSNCLKEAFTLSIPAIAKGHIERNHLAQLNAHLQKVLRNIFLSQTWMDSIDASISCTNTYIYLKKQVIVASDSVSEGFETCQPPQISTNLKHFKFCLNYNPSERTNCCNNLLIFDESGMENKESTEHKSCLVVEEHIVWCRSKGLLKGFKDCFINKVSVCELW